MLSRTILVAVAVLAACFVASPTANADDNRCPPGKEYIGSGCVDDGEDDDDDPIDTGCAQNDPLVSPAPCQMDGYTYILEYDSYLKALRPDQNEMYRPPDGELSGTGEWTGPPEEGHMYEARKLAGVPGGYHWGQYDLMWLPDGPGEPPPEVDPEELAQTILDGMSFEPPEIGMAPHPIEQDADSMGLVGAPAWMWIANPGSATWGPLIDDATEGGITVTVTAQVNDATWDLGDGTTVSCDTSGDAYDTAYGVRASPTCGHTYEHTSRDQPDQAYTVTATTNWSAEWESSTGVTGTLDVDPLTASAHVRIGERQLIEQ